MIEYFVGIDVSPKNLSHGGFPRITETVMLLV